MEWSPAKIVRHKCGQRDDSISPVSESVIKLVEDLNVLSVDSRRSVPAAQVCTPTSPDPETLAAHCFGCHHKVSTLDIAQAEDEDIDIYQTTKNALRCSAPELTILTFEEQALIVNMKDLPRQFE